MVKPCGGLPLAIVVLGGILSTKNSLSEWEVVYQNIKSYLWKDKTIGASNSEVEWIMALSYYDLPFQLKPCFLYLGCFPEDAEIFVDTLYQRWIAEGMVLVEDRVGEESMMELAERYLGELGQRGMVQLQTSYLPGNKAYASFRLHDLMRDLCLLQGEKESFLKYIRYYSKGKDSDEQYRSQNESSVCKLRRLAITLVPGQGLYVPPRKKISSYLRTFQLEGNQYFYDRRTSKSIKSQLHHFEMLHVLSIEGLHQGVKPKLPKAIGKLIHLRYLSLKNSGFLFLPSSLGKLKHLQTLDLRVFWSLKAFVPNILWKMKGLTSLYLPDGWRRCSLRLDGLNKLEILENFRDDLCCTEDLIKLTNTRVLVVSESFNLENLELIANYVQRSNTLHHVSIHNRCDPSSMGGDKGVKVLKQLLFGRSIHYLNTKVAMWKEIPEFESNMPSSLVELNLVYCGLDTEHTICETLEKFIHLRKLKLQRLERKEMVFQAMSFPQLRELELWDFENLEVWVVERGAMPKLRSLWICNLAKLKAIPDGLKFVTTVEELDIHKMPLQFKHRILISEDGQEGEDFHKISHIPLIKYDYELVVC